ncbi:Pre-mRNA-splicing factor [Lachancea thermotolerans]
MDVFGILNDRSGPTDEARVYKQLWELLKRDPTSIHALLSHEFMNRPIEELAGCVAQECLEKRLVCLCVLDFRLRSGCVLPSPSDALSSIFSTVSMVQADPQATNACFRILSTVLAFAESTQTVSLRQCDVDCISSEHLVSENAAVLMDYVYLALTHPWISESEAQQWLSELYRSGVFWWLRQKLQSTAKLDFLETLFEDTMKRAYNSFIQTMQTFLRAQGIAKEWQFCGASKFSELFDPMVLKNCVEDALAALKIQPRTRDAGTAPRLLAHLSKRPIQSRDFWQGIMLDRPALDLMWISPSRDMFTHASKTYMHEFAKLQCDIKNFILRINSRYSISHGKLTGNSKYATSAYELGQDPVTKSWFIKVAKTFAPEAQVEKWGDIQGKRLCLSRLDGAFFVVQVASVHKVGDMLQLFIGTENVSGLQNCQLLSVLSTELEFQVKAVDDLLKFNLENERLQAMTPMTNLVRSSCPSKTVILSNLFSDEQQIKNFLHENTESVGQKPSKRRLVPVKEAISLDLEKGKWAIEKAVKNSPKHDFTLEQIESVIHGVCESASCVNGDVGTGKATIIAAIIDNLHLNSFYKRFPQTCSRFLIVCDTDETCQKIASYLSIIQPQSVVHYSNDTSSLIEKKKKGVKEALSRVQEIASILRIPGDHSSSVPAALSFLQHFLEPMLHDYRASIKTNDEISKRAFPLLEDGVLTSPSSEMAERIIETSYQVAVMYDQLQKWQFLFLNGDLEKTLTEACDLLLISKDRFQKCLVDKKLRFNSFESLVICNADFFEPSEIWRALSLNTHWQRTIFSGDFANSPLPYVARQLFSSKSLQFRLTTSYNTNREVLRIRFPYEEQPDPVPVLYSPVQVIKTPGKIVNNINWDEAEYCVLLYAYLRLAGYPAKVISIIALNPYQKYAIDTELEDWLQLEPSHKDIKKPSSISSLENNRSHRNDIVIISTAGIQPNVPFLSRYARRGLLVLSAAGDDLQIVAGESFPSVKSDKREARRIQNLDQLKGLVDSLLCSKGPRKQSRKTHNE